MANEISTTIAGQSFYESPLGHFVAPDNSIGLPGIGPINSKKLKSHGICDASALFGMYLMFHRNREVFLEYLIDHIGIVINKQELKDALIDTLQAKWNKLKDY